MIRPTALALLSFVLSAPFAEAHPHIFIDTGHQLIFDDQGRLAAVRTVWIYDAFYSLLILEDMGLDPDADGTLTAAEAARLDGFDMKWQAGFAGDLYALQNAQALALTGPMEHAARFQNGRIVTTHLRAFTPRIEVGSDPVILQVYDPTYYTAYSITIEPKIEGRADCTAAIFVPQATAASDELKAALAELNAVETLDDLGLDSIPAIGASLAEEVRLTCDPPA